MTGLSGGHVGTAGGLGAGARHGIAVAGQITGVVASPDEIGHGRRGRLRVVVREHRAEGRDQVSVPVDVVARQAAATRVSGRTPVERDGRTRDQIGQRAGDGRRRGVRRRTRTGHRVAVAGLVAGHVAGADEVGHRGRGRLGVGPGGDEADAGGQGAVAVDVIAGHATATSVVGRRSPVEGDGRTGLGVGQRAGNARRGGVGRSAGAVDLHFGQLTSRPCRVRGDVDADVPG